MFTNKAEYLTWRSQWKAEYAALSNEIREVKKDRKSKDKHIQSCAQVDCWRLRIKATKMLEERKKSKVLAQSQYLAAKAVATPQTA
jgi:hypothetical protein